jgi:hypothetical protein
VPERAGSRCDDDQGTPAVMTLYLDDRMVLTCETPPIMLAA